MNKLRKILYQFIVEDDEKRQTIKYDLGKNVDKTIKKILNLRLSDFHKK